MAVVIDIAGLPTDHIVFGPSPLAELGAALHVLSEPGHHPARAEWAASVHCALPADLADRLCAADFLWRSTRSDILLPAVPGRSFEEDLDAVDGMSDERYVGAALEISCAAWRYGKTGVVSPLTDPVEREKALERAAARGPRQRAFVARLLADPASVRAWIRRLLEDCYEVFFARAWDEIRPRLAADARHKTELLKRKGLADAMAAVSPAVSVDGPAGRLVIDKMYEGRTTALDPEAGPGVTFLPTAFAWPHLLVLHARDWRPVIQYPMADPQQLRHAVPASGELLARRLSALAHPTRLRMCRSLALSPHTTGELATSLSMTAPEVSRHLAVMRKAGLLSTRRQGRYVQHCLELGVVARLGSEFLETVLR
ncbi:DUF5937 family protein [Streptomyces sp. NPDC059853]|uniref:DUF5937 family protein n=1 Tax=Streptomyces sp. NPDC059853 TaxID=3346973 RepID=UPI00364C266E